MAKLLAQKGANVVIVARDAAKLQAAKIYISVIAESLRPLCHVQLAIKMEYLSIAAVSSRVIERDCVTTESSVIKSVRFDSGHGRDI